MPDTANAKIVMGQLRKGGVLVFGLGLLKAGSRTHGASENLAEASKRQCSVQLPGLRIGGETNLAGY